MNTTRDQAKPSMDNVDLTVEMVPPNAHNSIAAVLYQVGGEAFDPFQTTQPFSNALREALTERLIPRHRSARRRYLAAVVVEDESALSRPPHLRPGLVLAMRISEFLAGGLLLEDVGALGWDRTGQAAAIGWLAEHAGTKLANWKLPELSDPRLAIAPVGTFTIGYLGPVGRYLDPSLLHNAVTEWNRDAQNLLSAQQRDAEREAAIELADAVAAHAWKPTGMTWPSEAVLASMLVGDLSADAAATMVEQLRDHSASTDRVVETLQLLGYLNPSGNRVWNRSILATVEHK